MGYLQEIEDSIKERLTARIPSIHKVSSLTQNSDWKKATQIQPALAMFFDGADTDVTAASAGRGRLALNSAKQPRQLRFMIFSITKSMRTKSSRDEIEAYELLDQVREAVMGWRPVTGAYPIQLGEVRFVEVSCGICVYLTEIVTTVCTPEPTP
jgi:hypothetical protein